MSEGRGKRVEGRALAALISTSFQRGGRERGHLLNRFNGFGGSLTETLGRAVK